MDNATEESIMDIIGKLKNIDYINPDVDAVQCNDTLLDIVIFWYPRERR